MRTVVGRLVMLVTALLLLAWSSAAVAGSVPAMSDAELDAVYGGESSEPTPFVPGPGTVGVGMTQTISGAAQQGASALIMVNALGSVVTAQVNVVANFGTLGASTQTSTAGPAR